MGQLRRVVAVIAATVGLAACGAKKEAPPGPAAEPGPAPTEVAQAEAAAPEVVVEGPQVVVVNKDYNRLSSRLLVRRIRRPTRANLEFAVYDSNVMVTDPKRYEPKPPAHSPTLGTLPFRDAFEAGSVVDRLDQTPLAPREKDAPMAWTGLREFLEDWDFQKPEALVELAGKVSDEKWNDDDVPIAYQELTRAYVHDAGDGKKELWVRVEFKQWVTFLDRIDDEDGDGFAEIYGKVPSSAVTGEIFDQIARYQATTFTADEIKAEATRIGTHLYPKYNTETWDEEQLSKWPTEKVKTEVGDELKALGEERPTIVIEARPFGKTLYNVYIVEGFAE